MTRKHEEHDMQCAFIAAARKLPGCEWIHAIPNAMPGNVVSQVWMKREGRLAGVLDVFLPRACKEEEYQTEGERRNGEISLIIVGAETGPKRRPMNLDWARSVRDQCKASGVPFWFNQDSDRNKTLDGVEHHPEFWK